MGEHRRGQALDVVRNRIFAAFQKRQRLHRAVEGLRAARAHAQRQRFVIARLLDDGEHVIHHRLFHGDAMHGVLQLTDVLSHQVGGLGFGKRHGAIAQDFALAGCIRVADAQAHQETVELRLRQRIGAMMLHRILRRDHHERAGQGMRVAIDGDLPFVHGFEERRLRFGRGAIDLISQQEIAEDRPRLEFEYFFVSIINGYAQDVAGKHVAGKLQAMEAA